MVIYKDHTKMHSQQNIKLNINMSGCLFKFGPRP